MNIIDAGTNIGFTALYFLDKFSSPNIICVEPEDSNFSSLKFNLQKYNEGNITLLKGGLWSKKCKLKITQEEKLVSDWAFKVEETNENSGLAAYSVNDLITQYSLDVIDILKIDVEGSEKEIFVSENVNLDFLKVTKCIVIEIHEFAKCEKEIINILENYNFEIYYSGESTIGINKNFLDNEVNVKKRVL